MRLKFSDNLNDRFGIAAMIAAPVAVELGGPAGRSLKFATDHSPFHAITDGSSPRKPDRNATARRRAGVFSFRLSRL
jgi:hypothetical protein